MNVKIFRLITAVLIVSLTVIPLVIAKPGAEKNNPKFLDYTLHIEFASASDDYPSEWKWNPPAVMDDLEPPYSQYLAETPEGARILFVGNRIWYLPELPFPTSRYVQIDDVVIPLSPDDFFCLYDVTWIYAGDGFGIYQLSTTITLDSPEYTGSIEISSIEKVTVDSDQLLMIGEGTFVGNGVINGQKVKLVGERLAVIDLSFVAPPTMEEKGTLQFIGNSE